MIWDRLVQVDDAAKRVAAAEDATRPILAWRAILTGLASTGELDFEGLALLQQTDQAAFGLLIDGDAEAAPAPKSGNIPRLIESLERATVDG
ncbi:hypothetical protein DCE93_08495 [Agromyces badenianii]|uniref:Uncharacterized protein n=1 Tax=Agromyces badenianii TaxID=2080742 RepID=A0A2S0WWM2_9MICO|nr:hypothetical protein [Agromyces badenianii]AWB95698.1 hypothetical protein DCE93_08495 [Agromyces badenianii]